MVEGEAVAIVWVEYNDEVLFVVAGLTVEGAYENERLQRHAQIVTLRRIQSAIALSHRL